MHNAQATAGTPFLTMAIIKTNINNSYSPDPSHVLNTIHLEQKTPLTENTLGQSHRTLDDPRHESIAETTQMSLNQWYQKPFLYSSGIWSLTDTQNQVLTAQPITQIIQNLQTTTDLAMRGNAFFRSGFRFELKLTSSPFHSGKLAFYYIPPGTDVINRSDIYQFVMFPCVYADAGNSTTAVLDVPFVTIKDYFSTQNPDTISDLGIIGVVVLNPLRIGTGGPTSIEFALFITPTENDLSLPVRSHTVAIQEGASLDATALLSLPDTLSMLTDKLGISSLMHNLEEFGNVRHLLNAIGDPKRANIKAIADKDYAAYLKDVASHSSSSVPNNVATPQPLENSAPTVSNISGLTNEHLSLIPEKTEHTQTPHQSRPDDEMTLDFISRTPSLISISTIGAADTSGTVLTYFPVNPMLVPGVNPTNTTDGVYNPTYLSYVCEPFAFWRGSIDYHFTFASTEQHKCKLLVGFVPFDSLNATGQSTLLPNPTINQLSAYPCEIFDLSLNREFTYKVPFNSETPYKTLSDYYKLRPGALPTSASSTNNTLGVLFVMILNKLTYPSTVSPTINYNVYIKAGEDFQVRGLKNNPDINNIFPVSYINIQSLDVAYESSLEGMRKHSSNYVGVKNQFDPSPSFQSDNSEHNLYDLLARYYPQYAYTFNLAANSNRNLYLESHPGPIDRLTRAENRSDPVFRNLIVHFKELFAMWKGSLNFFILHNTTVNNPILLTAAHSPLTTHAPTVYPSTKTTVNGANVGLNYDAAVPGNTIDLSVSSIYSHLSNLRVNPTIEITTPHRSRFRRLYTTLTPNAGRYLSSFTGELSLLYSNPSDTAQQVSATVYQSLGDDFRFKYLIPPQSRQVRRTAAPA